MSENCFRRPEVNVVVTGLDGAGKTATVERLKAQFGAQKKSMVPLDKLKTTMGMNLAKLDLCGCRVMVWDLGGSPKLRGLWERYYGDAHAWIYVVDAADTDRLDEAAAEFASACDHHDLLSLPCLVLANKQDRGPAVECDDLERSLDLAARRSAERRILLRGSSAVSAEGIAEAVTDLVRVAKKNALYAHDVPSAAHCLRDPPDDAHERESSRAAASSSSRAAASSSSSSSQKNKNAAAAADASSSQ